MSTPNVALLRQTLAYIETHPEEWNQGTWHCGTTACFAGHAAVLDGAVWHDARGGELILARDDDANDETLVVADGTRCTFVDTRAQRILGLTEEQAEILFYGGNSLDDLRHQVEHLTGGAS